MALAMATRSDGVKSFLKPFGHADGLEQPLLANALGQGQGQLQLNRCAGNYFCQEFLAPAAGAAFHGGAVLAGMLLQQR